MANNTDYCDLPNLINGEENIPSIEPVENWDLEIALDPEPNFFLDPAAACMQLQYDIRYRL